MISLLAQSGSEGFFYLFLGPLLAIIVAAAAAFFAGLPYLRRARAARRLRQERDHYIDNFIFGQIADPKVGRFEEVPPAEVRLKKVERQLRGGANGTGS